MAIYKKLSYGTVIGFSSQDLKDMREKRKNKDIFKGPQRVFKLK